MEVALVILDGWGIGRYWPVAGDPVDPSEADGRDAIAAADTPTYDEALETGVVGHLRADGETVGLPAGQMGNSAVGHLTIGAGTVIEQEFTRINTAIEQRRLRSIEALDTIFTSMAAAENTLHLWGLLSDGGVHGDVEHLRALIQVAAERGCSVQTHLVTDGRDMPPRSALRLLARLERTIERAGTGEIATLTGRYFAMDRDENWDRTYRAFEAIVHGRGRHVVPSARAALEAAYARGETDEFVQPTIVGEAPSMTAGDGVLLANFRADRARQLTRMVTNHEPVWPQSSDPPELEVVTMSEYDERFSFPVAFESIEPEATLGSKLSEAGYTQFRIAETEKYAHVTYFLNGGREVEYEGEHRTIVPSPPVATYDLQPEMSAPEVTDTTLTEIETTDPDVLVLNYANPDMVGHTGEYPAAVAAIEAVDAQLGRLLEALDDVEVLVIADHGNAENMGTEADPHTAHTVNPVPCIYLPSDHAADHLNVRSGGTLADVAPTVLSLLDVPIPESMTGQSLLE